jgi:hypothetical protein
MNRKLSERVRQRVAEADAALQVQLPVTWEVGDGYAHFETPRGFGVTFQKVKHGPCHVLLATKLARAPSHRQDGIIRHELGHVIDLTVNPRHLDHWCKARGVRLPPRRHGEVRADSIAEAVWQAPIFYDEDTVQSTLRGTRPRPKHLGK